MENILDFIKVYKGAVSNELCDDIVNKYKDSDKFKLSETIGGLERKIRNCYLLDLLDDKDIDGRLFKEQSININKYAEEFPNVSVEQDTGYGLLKYEEGGFYTEHVDHAPKLARTVSCSIILNDDYEGGDFQFEVGAPYEEDRIITLTPSKGCAIVFPSFKFHRVTPVTKGVRYSLVGWICGKPFV